MAHVMKHTKAGCGHMLAHYERSAENISNINLDRTRTHLNYNLATHQQMNQWQFIKKRCSEVRCQNRKDVNVMVSWVVTVPKELPEFLQGNFFQFTYDFLEERYGKENVVSAYVHMDEVTPHMHFAFVPVTLDRKKGIEKVSAKEVITRQELKRFHNDLEAYLSEKMYFDVQILNEATKNGNKAIIELQRGTAEKQVKELQEEIENLETKYFQKLDDIAELIDEQWRIETEIQKTKSSLEELKNAAQTKEKALLQRIEELEEFKQFVLELHWALEIDKDFEKYKALQKQQVSTPQKKPLKTIKKGH